MQSLIIAALYILQAITGAHQPSQWSPAPGKSTSEEALKHDDDGCGSLGDLTRLHVEADRHGDSHGDE